MGSGARGAATSPFAAAIVSTRSDVRCRRPVVHVGGDGYGRFTLHRAGTDRTVTPHQVAAVLAFGAVPLGSTVLHDCDVRLCCSTRPRHVRVSTQSESMARAARRGHAAGPRPGHVDVRGPAAASHAVHDAIRAALRESPNQTRAGLSRVLAAALAAGDPLRSNLALFDATSVQPVQLVVADGIG
jgi:hypothetical protein